MLKDLVIKNRSYRRFYQDEKIEPEILKTLIDHARLAASGQNMQPLKYIISTTPKKNAEIFKNLAWAGYLKNWPGPQEGERPSAYIIVLGDTSIKRSFDIDLGIAAQTILLAAAEMGLGGCMLGSVKRQGIKDIFNLDSKYEVLLAIALGKPKENVIIEEVGPDGDIKYWRDEHGNHHVPKRRLEDIILDAD